ncbi:MAG: hypothetical protein AMS25_00555 [Gemmatimonas sp. SM23_52]|nr:MAG: hypothetical protein AMS25_00555 [Gemmatimonas sp. SM23_52]
MMPILYLLVVVILAKIILIDSPVGKALGEAVRNLVPPRAAEGSVSHAELETLRRDVEELRDRLDRVVEEQSFLTRLLSEPRHLSLGPGEIEDVDNRR